MTKDHRLDTEDHKVLEEDQESIRGLSDLYFPEEPDESHSPDASVPRPAAAKDEMDILLEMGKLTSQQHAHLRAGADPVGAGLQAGFINADDVLEARAKLLGLEFRRIEPANVEKEAFEKLEVDFIKNAGVCPVALEQGTLVVATSDPANIFAIEEVKRQAKMEVRVVVCRQEDIEKVCAAFSEEKDDYCLDDIISDITDVEVVEERKDDFEDLKEKAGQSPIIKFVNYIISKAVREGASDIHIEPKDNLMKLRYRIDGMLFEVMQSPLKMHPAVVSRIKVMSNLDISERRLPQDGKITVIVGGRGIDLRVSTLPTNHGEKVVIRVLDSKSVMRGLEQLGMEPETMAAFSKQIVLPHGILLVTGPTGSGKSTTLYAALCQMDGSQLNILTVEDPVEYELGFCSQVQVSEKIGLDFATALRSLLRQDPDVIMIGEIRDNETARIAVQAALTGHLVLSTLHTNDAASSITRLVNIGIDAYLIAASLNAAVAQRLVRRICPKCKEIYKVPENIRKYVEKAGVKPDELFHGAGCDNCRKSGYAGRVGIYELLAVNDGFRDMINRDSSVNNIRQVFRESRQPTLFDDGIKKVKQGLTTIEEVLRVTEVYGKNEKEVFVENIK